MFQTQFINRKIKSLFITLFLISLITSCIDYEFEVKKDIIEKLKSSNDEMCAKESDPKILEENSKSNKEEERVCVAKNPNTSQETLENLVTNDNSGKVKVYALYNDKLSTTALINILQNDSKGLKDYQTKLKDEDGENIILVKKYIEIALKQQSKDTIRELFATIDQDIYQFVQKDMGN